MEMFNPGQNFNTLNRVEISSTLNSKLPFKKAIQLHAGISTRYTEFKFQLGLGNPRWNCNQGWKFKNFHIIDILSNPEWKFYTTHAWIFCLYLKKIKITTSQARFKWTMVNLSIFCYELLQRIWQFILKIPLYWILINNGCKDLKLWYTTLTCWSITNFNFLLTAGFFVLICFAMFSVMSSYFH